MGDGVFLWVADFNYMKYSHDVKKYNNYRMTVHLNMNGNIAGSGGLLYLPGGSQSADHSRTLTPFLNTSGLCLQMVYQFLGPANNQTSLEVIAISESQEQRPLVRKAHAQAHENNKWNFLFVELSNVIVRVSKRSFN